MVADFSAPSVTNSATVEVLMVSLISPSATVRGISIFAVSVVKKIAITNTRFQSVKNKEYYPRRTLTVPGHHRQHAHTSV